jgi:murein L,D-transpeptidase YafK
MNAYRCYLGSSVLHPAGWIGNVMNLKASLKSIGGAFGPRTLMTVAAVVVAGSLLSACQDGEGLRSGRGYAPIPAETLALMREKGMTKHSPILFRAFKKEAELEIWKMKADGQYALLKSYPMCRWSGQLGPKKREGDRQVPEGFYAITPNKMNPNSAYYLSFDVGYPNAYDRAHNRTGSLIMVHGACSSAGCFSMTDEQIAEIYAIAREAFGGGQPSIQMQSMPFRMTPENLAKHRFDPNMKFWREIKEGVDHFDITRREPQVAVCGGRYVFNSKTKNSSDRLDARAACPPLEQEENLRNMVAEKNRREQQQVAELVSKGMPAVKVVYADGGQHPSFNHVRVVSRPEAIETGPTEVHIDANGKPVKTPVQVAAKPGASSPSGVAAAPRAAAASTAVARTATTPAPAVAAMPVTQPATVPASASAFGPLTAPSRGTTAAEVPFYKRWLGGASAPAADTPATAPSSVPAVIPVVPTPPRRAETDNTRKPAPKRDRQAELPVFMRGGVPALPASLMAFSPDN